MDDRRLRDRYFRRNRINRISHRWLLACAVVALFAVVEGSFAIGTVSADTCMHRCLGDPDCRTLAPCGTGALIGTCCEWSAAVLPPNVEANTAPNNRQQDRPSAALELHDVSSLFAHSNLADFKPDKAYSAGAGTATYLATARLRI